MTRPHKLKGPREIAAAPSRRTVARTGEYALDAYLVDISRTPLLTAEQEVELAARIKDGDEHARDHMIRANLRLVVSVAMDYQGLGLPLLDMISEGNISLMRAVELFDPNLGKLSTYAAGWIKQGVRRALANQSKTIRLPVHLVDVVSKIRKTALQLHGELGYEPSDAEIAERLGMTPQRVTQLITASYRPKSLDDQIGEDETRLRDLIPDTNTPTAFEDYDQQTRHTLLRQLLPKLKERELIVLTRRFGLDGGDEQTLDELGQQFGVSRERIRQIEGDGLRKLRKWIEEVNKITDPDMEDAAADPLLKWKCRPQ